MLHTLSHCLSIGIIGLEAHPTWWLRLGREACPVHTTNQQTYESDLIQLRTISVLLLKLLLQDLNKVSHIAHHVEYLCEID